MDSGNDTAFGVGRCHSSPESSRESSPIAKRQKRPFTPTSDDDVPVVPAPPDEDTETLTHENPPLIRQAVGFSWAPSASANVNTYQATVPPQPAVPYFLPGQAPLAPPNPKTTKPRAPRKKKGTPYLGQTGKFKLTAPNLPSSSSSPDSGFASFTSVSAGNSAHTSVSTGATQSPMTSTTGYASGYANGNPTNSTWTAAAPAAPSRGTKRPRKPTKKVSASASGSRSQSNAQPPVSASTSVSVQRDNSRGPSMEGAGQVQAARPGGGTSAERTNTSTPATQDAARRPMRMVTLLIEDTRSGVSDPQLAEVKVPLKVADDPEDGFWGDALEICNALQSGPSRIDGPAKVYTMRGKFRQIFMRLDQFDQLQVQSAHLGVTKERILNVFVEAPVPQGQLPHPPVTPPNSRPACNSGSEYEATSSPSATHSRPTYSLPTREDQIERLSRSQYAKQEKRRMPPVSENGSYGRPQRRDASPNMGHRPSWRDPPAGSIQRLLTPPIPGRPAETPEEEDEAIANYIRSSIENNPGWIDYMQSKAKPQRVSEVLKQYTFVEDRVREFSGLQTPPHWDGAPSRYVARRHVWRVLKLDAEWGEDCRETLELIGYYGQTGSRYEDSRIIDMINDTSPPKPNAMSKFLRFLREVDDNFTQDMLTGQFAG